MIKNKEEKEKNMCRINPKVDFVFKKLFGSEENKDLLMSFINSVLPDDEQINYIELRNPYNLANFINDKMSILDVKASDENGTWYDIEIQVAPQSYYDKRALYYWAKVYSDQLLEKGRYGTINKVIGINILDFNYFPDEDYHSMYKIYNSKTKTEYSDLFELHFIELQKFHTDLNELKTSLDRWVTFLNNAYEYSEDKIPKELQDDRNIKKAIETLENMSLKGQEREIYEQRLKETIDRVEQIETALNKGRQEGIKQGIKEGKEQGIKEGIKEGSQKKAIEIAKNLLDVLDNETISLKTGLSLDEIEKLR